MSTCLTCGRDLSARECSDPDHRAARGFDPEPTDKAGQRFCPKCRQWKPIEKFWNRSWRTLAKSCGRCRHQAKARRNRDHHIRERVIREEADRYWEAQAASHQ